MQERQAEQKKAHGLVLKDRNTLQLTGIVDVLSFDSAEIILETTAGMLMIRGNELHMSHLAIDAGEVNVEGALDSLTYSESHKASKQAGKILGRLFK